MPDVSTPDQILIDLYNAGDAHASQQLFIKHHKLILKIIFDVTRGHYYDDDCLQAGAVGLCEACRRFKPEVGVVFTTYAYYWIKKYVMMEVCNEILPAGGIVFGRDLKDKMFKYIGLKTTGFSEDEIAVKMKMTKAEVARIATMVSQASRPLSTSARVVNDRNGTEEYELYGLPSVASAEDTVLDAKDTAEYTRYIEEVINSMESERERYLLNHTLGLNGHDIIDRLEMLKELGITARALGDLKRTAYRRLKVLLKPPVELA